MLCLRCFELMFIVVILGGGGIVLGLNEKKKHGLCTCLVCDGG